MGQKSIILSMVLLMGIVMQGLQGAEKIEELKRIPVWYGYSARQGCRKTMEDLSVVCCEKKKNYALFGLFDGHGKGSQIANICASNIVELYDRQHHESPRMKLEGAIKKLEEASRNFLKKYPSERSGTTLLASVYAYGSLERNKIFLHLAHVGDSRGMVIDNNKVVFTTVDHKPLNEEEKKRIMKINSNIVEIDETTHEKKQILIEPNNRIKIGSYSLAMSRSIGDEHYKGDPYTGGLIATPEINLVENVDSAIVLLATDGFWNKMEIDDKGDKTGKKTMGIVTFVQKFLQNNKDQDKKNSKRGENGEISLREESGPEWAESKGTSTILTYLAQALRDKAYKRGSKDNISVMIMSLNKEFRDEEPAKKPVEEPLKPNEYPVYQKRLLSREELEQLGLTDAFADDKKDEKG